ncbi:uncharacterized protein IUM83_00988 [Phytophthora cinnamomi]|uniref:uncharacterized protein n=1 Tax=Phytophthora cinnamomi TaxID=4785 RepID=UPI003559FD0E|nr:hypothetical protein IUM83_00991 [Phytophthora cinnamomi]KAG6610155.1 hypothetical protein IUM83_00988 [Phytophthora cinnamomi]
MPLPLVQLYLNTNQRPTVQCPGNHQRSPRNVKATFPPAFCWTHANNQDSTAGWAYIKRDEAAMLTILRERGWFEDAYDELRACDLEDRLGTVVIDEQGSDNEESTE